MPTAGVRRSISPAGDRHSAFDAITVGVIAAASRMINGPVLGSVPLPVKRLPTRPWPAIHRASAKTAPPARKMPGRRATSGPRPMTTDTRARIHAVWVPDVENRLPRLVRKWAYQPGCPSAIPTTALWMEVVVRLSGSKNRTAASDQYPLHTTSGVTERPMPWAAADVAMPVGRSLQSGA